MAIYLDPEELVIVKDILKDYPPCYAFGSRVKGTHRKFSDLDICFKEAEPLPYVILGDIEEKFSESDLPFKVDVLDYHRVSPGFQKIIETSWVPFPRD